MSVADVAGLVRAQQRAIGALSDAVAKSRQLQARHPDAGRVRLTLLLDEAAALLSLAEQHEELTPLALETQLAAAQKIAQEALAASRKNGARVSRLTRQMVSAVTELERASDVRPNRTHIIGNTHILLQRALRAEEDAG